MLVIVIQRDRSQHTLYIFELCGLNILGPLTQIGDLHCVRCVINRMLIPIFFYFRFPHLTADITTIVINPQLIITFITKTFSASFFSDYYLNYQKIKNSTFSEHASLCNVFACIKQWYPSAQVMISYSLHELCKVALNKKCLSTNCKFESKLSKLDKLLLLSCIYY